MRKLCPAFIIFLFFNIAHAQIDLSKGLVAYYPFNGNAKDSSGNALDGSVTGATLTTDRFGRSNSAYYFDGKKDNYVKASYDGKFNLGNSFSFSFWINQDSVPPNTISTVLSKGPNNNNYYGYFIVTNFTDRFFMRQSSSQVDLTENGNFVPPNKWTFVVCIRDGGNGELRYYINDVLKETEKTGFTFSSTAIYPLVIGRHFNSSNGTGPYPYQFSGKIDDVRIYNRALTRDEVTKLFQGINDIRATSVLLPFNNTCNDTLSGKFGVIIKNTGEIPASGFSVGADLSLPYQQNFNAYYQDTLQPNMTDTVYFSNPLDLTYAANYKINAYPIYTDDNLMYDTASTTFYNSPFPVFKVQGPDIVCAGGQTTYSVPNENSYTYEWTVTGGNVTSGAGSNSVTVLWSKNGQGKIVAKVTNARGCEVSEAIDITITGPEAKFNLPSPTACKGISVQFSDQSSATDDPIVSEQWNFGDGNNCQCDDPSHKYTVAGQYEVSLTVVTLKGCSNTTSKFITVTESADVNIQGPDTICESNTQYSVVAGAQTYQWLVAGGSIISGQGTNAVVVDWQPGQASITAEVTNGTGCKGTQTKSVFVKGIHQTDFILSSPTICQGEQVQLTDISTTTDSILAWKWSFGDSRTSTIQNPKTSYPAPGTYKIILQTETYSGCISAHEEIITVNAKPGAAFSADSVCLGNPVIFINKSVGSVSKYQWFFGAGVGNTSTVKDPVFTFTSAGLHEVKLIVTGNGGCTDTSVKMVKILPAPSLTIGKTINGRALSLNVSDTNYTSYSWDFGDQTNTSVKNPAHIYVSDGTYIVKLTVRNEYACESLITDTVVINTSGIVGDEPESLDLNIYPNPFEQEVGISFSLDKASHVGMHLYDINGRQLLTKALTLSAGQHKETLRINSGDLAPGIYSLQIMINDVSVRRTVFRVK